MKVMLPNLFVLMVWTVALCGLLAVGCLIDLVWAECSRARETRDRWATVTRPTTANEALHL